MAEMIVRMADKVNRESPYLDVKCTKRGDVIAICEDGWPWSKAELTNPDWTLVKVTGVLASDLSAYLAAEPGDPKVNQMLQRRAFYFDLDAYAASGKTACSASDAQTLKQPRPAKADPNVLA